MDLDTFREEDFEIENLMSELDEKEDLITKKEQEIFNLKTEYESQIEEFKLSETSLHQIMTDLK